MGVRVCDTGNGRYFACSASSFRGRFSQTAREFVFQIYVAHLPSRRIALHNRSCRSLHKDNPAYDCFRDIDDNVDVTYCLYGAYDRRRNQKKIAYLNSSDLKNADLFIFRAFYFKKILKCALFL